MRDDFSEKTKLILARQVGHRCSNPKCRRATSGPDSTRHKGINVGVASHISAAAPGGERYDGSLLPEARKSASNGVWLCQTCAKLIDSDSAKYTSEVLLDWKETAVHLAAADLQGLSPLSPLSVTDSHSITFKAAEWKLWRHRGILPGDTLCHVSGWQRGDVKYSLSIRFRNNLPHEEVLHRFRTEFIDSTGVIHSEEYGVDEGEVVLPSGKWVSLQVSYGLRDLNVFQRAKSVWFKAEVVGDGETERWLVAEIDHAAVKPPSD